ncbi:MAG: AAA family ATPase [Aphanizomenon gracile PMC649.10]|nr:AAA family ATPase [Aphanizomenon gracile PMC649.10]
MQDYFYNPFANNGNIVYDDDFVGRQDEIRTIQQRVINSPQAGCLAIVGAPRIGKSSLVYNTLIYPKNILAERKILTFRINLPDVKNHQELFRELVKQTLESLDDADSENEFILIKGKSLLEKNLQWLDLQSEVRKFFKKLKRSNWRIIAVIDEFDQARHIFKDGVGFQALRELAYQPEWSICLVTVSRRYLYEIGNQVDISNLPGIFKDEILRCFSQEELRTLLNKLQKIDFDVTNECFQFIWDNTGGHPHLASALSFELANSWLNSQKYNLEESLQEATSEFLKYYDNLIDILKEDDSLDKLLQILFGPVITATKFDAEKFVRYGLIKPNNYGYYQVFSSHFENYLRLVERSRDLWPLWRDTERKLRSLITEIMETEYGEDWPSQLEKSRPKLKKMIDQFREAQEKEKKSFGGRASTNLLDFSYPMNLYEIISSHWNLFEKILNQDKNYWSARFQLLAKLRNPMAHIRDEIIQEHERQIAEGYCQEILYNLEEYKRRIYSNPN